VRSITESYIVSVASSLLRRRPMSTKSSLSSPDCYRCTSPGLSIEVRIPLLVVYLLRLQLDRQPDASIGTPPAWGFLIGSRLRSGITKITDFQPVAKLDPATVQEELGRAKGEVVGFYRTTSAEPLTMSPEDRVLAGAFFNYPKALILLIEVGPSGPNNAAFFVWDQVSRNGDPLTAFPFDAARLAEAEQLVSLDSDEERIADAPGADVAFQLWSKIRANSARWLIPAMALAGGAVLYYSHRPFGPVPVKELPAQRVVVASPTKSPLGLTAERRGDDLLLSWNPELPAVASAITGMLLIEAGSDQRNFVLGPEELRSGRLIYTAAADQVNIRLHVVNSMALQTHDSVIVVLPPKADRRAVLAIRPTAAPTGAPLGRSAPPRLQPTSPRVPAQVGDASASQKILSRRQLGLAIKRQGEPKPPATASSVLPLDPPPAIKAVSSPPHSPFHELLEQGLSAEQPAHTASSSVAASSHTAQGPSLAASQTVPNSFLGPIVTAVPLVKKLPPHSDFVPPVPTRLYSPEIPANLRHELKQEVSVDVKVYVNPSGTVEYAELLSKGTGARRNIASFAVFESRRWKFRPAVVGGQPSEGEVILHYRFSPKYQGPKRN